MVLSPPVRTTGRRSGSILVAGIVGTIATVFSVSCGTPYFTVWVDNQTDRVVYVEVEDNLLKHKTTHEVPAGSLGKARDGPGNDFRGATVRVMDEACVEIAIFPIDTLMSGIVIEPTGRVSLLGGTPAGSPTSPGLQFDESLC